MVKKFNGKFNGMKLWIMNKYHGLHGITFFDPNSYSSSQASVFVL